MSRTRSALMLGGLNPRVPVPVAVAAVLIVVAAAAVGLGAGAAGWKLLPAAVAVMAGAAVLYRPFIGVLLLAATIPVEAILVFDGLGLGRLIGMAVFGAWLIQKVALRQSWRRLATSGFLLASASLLVLVLVSMMWARHPQPVRSGFIRLAQMVALALIVIDLTNSRRKLDAIAKTLVLTATLASGITLYQAEVLGLRRAGSEVTGGVNDTAVLLVTLLPLGFYLLRSVQRFPWKLLATLFIGISTVSVVTTFSRMNLLLLPPLLLLLFILAARDRPARRWLVAVAVAGSIGGILFVPWEKLEERTQTIGAYVDQTVQFGEEQAATSPRGYHLRIGLAIMRDHPILGAGYGNYGYLFRDEYQFQVAGGEKLYGTARSPHSSYVGMAADLGIVGLLLWLLVLLSPGVTGWQAWRRARRNRPPLRTAMLESLMVMLGLHIFAYSLYAPNQTDKLLWIVMAMCVAAGALVRTAFADAQGSASVELSPDPRRTGYPAGFRAVAR